MDREESSTPTYALNSTLIGMYKGNVLRFMRTHRFTHLDIFVILCGEFLTTQFHLLGHQKPFSIEATTDWFRQF